MAVARMRRVEVVGYRPVLDEVLAALQRAGVLEIDVPPDGVDTEAVGPDDERRRAVDEYAADARFVRDFLGAYHTNTQPFGAFVSEKFHFTADEFERLDAAEGLLALYRACEEVADGIASRERERERLTALVADLEPWCAVRLQIASWRGTEHVAMLTGTVLAGDAPRVRQALREVTPLASVIEYGSVGGREAWFVLAHRSVADVVRSTLASSAFTEVSFADLSDYPAEESARAAARLAAIDDEIAQLRERAAALSGEHYARAVALAESLDSDGADLAVRSRLGRTERTFLARGWVRASAVAQLDEALAPWSTQLDVLVREPADDEEPPVELDNPAWLRPFEVLTDLYGRPAYRDLDPTILLAPFFLLFFAICVGDVGYGAMLAGACWLIKTRLDVAPGVTRFMNLMIYGGVAAMVVGVGFASYFALPVDSLPRPLAALQLLDPLAGLQTFLVVTVVLGVTQVLFGVAVAAYDAFRRGDAAAAIFEQVSTIFLFVMVGVVVVASNAGASVVASWALVLGLLGTMLMQGRALEAALGDTAAPLWDRAVGWLWLAAVAVSMWQMATASVGTGLGVLAGASVVALVSRTGRRAVVALLGGAYSVYGMSAFLGDILSYTRLAALGLSGTLVGMVFNILAGLVWQPASELFASGGIGGWIGGAIVAVLAALVFVVGHVFNVVINLLGAFVHPARLQFVEFFSKFYEGGGRPMTPFRFVTKSVVLHAGSVRQEGGAGS